MLRYHEIAELNHRILNPFTDAKLVQLGALCRILPGATHLDLCCGKGELLCRWAQIYESRGLGVDISPTFLAAARERALELRVAKDVTFVEGETAYFVRNTSRYDIVSCIGATWIGGGLEGTLRLMRDVLKPGGLLLVGEPYWIAEPPDAACEAISLARDEVATLAGTLERIERCNLELVAGTRTV